MEGAFETPSREFPRGSRRSGSNAVEPIRYQTDRDAFERYLRGKSLRDLALYRFGFYTGRRIGDILRTKVGDVAKITDRGELRIRESLRIREEKTGKSIVLDLHKKLRYTLSKYLRVERAPRSPSLGALLLEPLFISRQKNQEGRSRPITRQRAGQLLRRAARACDLEYPVGCHSLRKTFGYLLHQHDVSLAVIGAALNHTDPAVTRRYIGLEADDVNNAISNLP